MVTNMEIWEYLFIKTLLQLSSCDRWTLTWGEGHLPPGPQWEEYREHASARFCCLRCGRTWLSAYVTLFFHMILRQKWQRGGRVGTVKGCILRQDCMKCGMGVPGMPEFEEEDIAIILSNLLIHIRQKCYGEPVKDKPRSVPIRWNNHGRHKRHLCDACRRGVCWWTPDNRGPRRFESSEDVGIPMEPLIMESVGETKAGCECFMWVCCGVLTIVIALLVLAALVWFVRMLICSITDLNNMSFCRS